MRLKNLLKLIIGIISSIIIIFFLYILFLWCYLLFPSGDDILYYIPNDYSKSQFIVVYNQKKGERKVKIDGKRVFRIPKSGILFTQFDLQEKLHKEYWCFVDKNGVPIKKIEKIRFDDDYLKLKMNKTYCYYGYIGSTFRYYIIGNPKEIKEEFNNNNDNEVETTILDSINNLNKFKNTK